MSKTLSKSQRSKQRWEHKERKALRRTPLDELFPLNYARIKATPSRPAPLWALEAE